MNGVNYRNILINSITSGYKYNYVTSMYPVIVVKQLSIYQTTDVTHLSTIEKASKSIL